jgi:hypothetical protein
MVKFGHKESLKIWRTAREAADSSKRSGVLPSIMGAVSKFNDLSSLEEHFYPLHDPRLGR